MNFGQTDYEASLMIHGGIARTGFERTSSWYARTRRALACRGRRPSTPRETPLGWQLQAGQHSVERLQV
jgi:hypothetical protein